MKNFKKIITLFIAILICVIILSCMNRTASYSSTMQQTLAEAAAIKTASEFKVKPIDFSAIKPLELGYGKTEEWIADLEPVPRAFADSFPAVLQELPKEEKIQSKKIIMIKKDETVTSGIIIDVSVKEIVLNWKYFRQKPDEFICDVSFTDADSGQKLFSGVVTVNSDRDAGSLYVGGRGPKFAVGPGMSFSGRIQAAANNMAWVMTKVMTHGKID